MPIANQVKLYTLHAQYEVRVMRGKAVIGKTTLNIQYEDQMQVKLHYILNMRHLFGIKAVIGKSTLHTQYDVHTLCGKADIGETTLHNQYDMYV